MQRVFARLVVPTHLLPWPDQPGRLFNPAGEYVDRDDPFWWACLGDGSLVLADPPDVVITLSPAPIETPIVMPAADPVPVSETPIAAPAVLDQVAEPAPAPADPIVAGPPPLVDLSSLRVAGDPPA